MKLIISVLALVALAATGGHHSDAFKEDISAALTPEEDRHPLKPDNNYVLQFNSVFLFEMYRSLVQIFWDKEKEDNSFHIPNQGTDLVNGILTAEAYNKQVVDTSGKHVATKPYFIYWPKFSRKYQQLPASSMSALAKHFNGDVAFRVADPFMDENLRMTYEIYDSGKAFYIDQDGKAYIYPGVISFNQTRDWIESRKYRMSPFQFNAPAIIGDQRMIWANVKKEVRHWYGDNIRDLIEPYLKKIGFTYCVDMDPYDWDNVKLNQKTDRQIIFIVAGIFWALEYVWDMIMAAKPGEKAKPAPQKSFLKKKPAAAAKATGSGKKERGEKIE